MSDAIEKRVKRRVAATNRKSEEADYQKRIVARLRAARVLFCHPANESKASPRYRAHLKAMGLASGVPDLLIFARSEKYPTYRGFALELKADGGRASPTQVQWIYDLREQGWAADVVHSEEQALALLRKWQLI